MASLTQIRTAIAGVLEGLPGIVATYRTVAEAALVPCVIVDVADPGADFVRAFGRGTDTWNFNLIVLCQYADAGIGQDELDAYVTGAGPHSIREAIWNNRTLGLTETDAHIDALTAYGAQYDVGEISYVGGTLSLIVHTPGKEQP